MMLEIDRVCFKVLNTLAARLLSDNKNRVVSDLYSHGNPHFELDVEAHYLNTFVKEMLRF